MKIIDYLLLKSPETRMIKETGRTSTRRIVLSMTGLILGIFFSFLITGINGIESSSAQKTGSEITKSQGVTQTGADKASNIKISFPKPKELASIGLIAFVICMLTYQGLYFSLKLYQNEPAFLVLFISFQYGFFWQSIVKGGAALLN